MSAASASKKSTDLSGISAKLVEEVKKAFPGIAREQALGAVRRQHET